MKRSAGILPFKIVDNKLFVYLEHPGGPYWQDKDLWSVCKGERGTDRASRGGVCTNEEREGEGMLVDSTVQ